MKLPRRDRADIWGQGGKTDKFLSTGVTGKVDSYPRAVTGWVVGELHLPVLHTHVGSENELIPARAIANLMDVPRLNLFPEPEHQPHHDAKQRAATKVTAGRRERELDQVAGLGKAKTMKMPLGVMVPLLLRAAQNNHAWLDDFAEDNVQIDADLHQVLMAFQDLPQRRAA